MTEPFHTSNSVSKEKENPLRNVLNALKTYHEHLLQTNTLDSQSPVEIYSLQRLLRLKGKDLQSALDRLYSQKEYEKLLNTDEHWNMCLLSLQKHLHPWNPETIPLVKYWCEMMFEQYPFTLSHNHIENFYKNSTYVEDEISHKELPERV